MQGAPDQMWDWLGSCGQYCITWDSNTHRVRGSRVFILLFSQSLVSSGMGPGAQRLLDFTWYPVLMDCGAVHESCV